MADNMDMTVRRVPLHALKPLGYAREGIPEKPEPAVYLYVVKCLACGLHMAAWSWYRNWHETRLSPGVLTCMECGATTATGAFYLVRYRLPDADIFDVPGLVGRQDTNPPFAPRLLGNLQAVSGE
jgi:hypothetical protein